MTNLHMNNVREKAVAPKRFRCLWFAMVVLIVLSFSFINGAGRAEAFGTRVAWLQVMDSCQQAIRGSSFVLTGNGLNVPKGPTPGGAPRRVAAAQGRCPLQRGNCLTVPQGCLAWNIPVPNVGVATYRIVQTGVDPNYVPCTGGSVCTGGPLVATLTINAAGRIAATVRNVEPDGFVVTWPNAGAPYTAAQTDPITMHNFQLGPGSCDGDNDADDHLTGSPSSHCDNDHDRSSSGGGHSSNGGNSGHSGNGGHGSNGGGHSSNGGNGSHGSNGGNGGNGSQGSKHTSKHKPAGKPVSHPAGRP